MSETSSAPQRKIFSRRAILAVAFALVAFVAALIINWRQESFSRGTVILGGRDKVAVEIAITSSARERGLSGRDRLADGQGMLFVFPAANTYSFWMKDMKFPIDIIWIKGDEVVDLTTDVPLPQAGQSLPLYYPRQPADRVLEVPAGYAQAHGLRTGEKVAYLIDSGK